MRRIYPIFLVTLCLCMTGAMVRTRPARAFFFFKPKKCEAALKFCDAVNEACGADECNQIFPGDGASGGPALSYTDNLDDTATDNNTKFMWEVKLEADDVGGNCADGNQANHSVHCVNNIYTWSASGSAADGTLFTDFLVKMNDRCDGSPAAEAVPCTTDADCTGVGGNGLCGHAGYQDWFIPDAKQLQSIVDYGTANPAIDSTFPGATSPAFYASATTDTNDSSSVWSVVFNNGRVVPDAKTATYHGRAVRLTCR